jgi:Squalene-hopene cyclase C-terminal domain/Prenyltransferase and squalene oxidase repeat
MKCRMFRPIAKPIVSSLALSLAFGPAIALAQNQPLRRPRTRTQQPEVAPELAPQASQVRGDEINPAQERAVARGLEWLASRQGPDGNFGGAGGGYGAHVAITALSGLALMSAGNLPDRGKYGTQVRKAVEFILASSQESGLLAADQSHGVMYGHGFAALFLGEVYGMTGDDAVKERLQKAISLIEKSQNTEGGWRYMPVPFDADISVTICQVMALRAARDAGIKVEKDVIDRAIAYVRRCQNADGGFSYMASTGSGGSGFPRSAAGVAALYYAGVFEGDELKRGLEYIRQFQPGRAARADRDMGSHYYYGQYYAVQAMFLAGGDYWGSWYPAIRDELIARQTPSGAWSQEVSDEYSTACALIILQMPNRYLPVFNGKGPGD